MDEAKDIQEALERLPEPEDLAWSQESETVVLEPRARHQVWFVATAIVLSGIVVAGIVLATLMAYRAPDTHNDWPSNSGVPPVPVNQLPTPFPIAPQDIGPNPVIMVAIDNNANTLNAEAHETNIRNAEFIDLLKRNGWPVSGNEANMIDIGLRVCNVIAAQPDPTSVETLAAVAHRLSVEKSISIDAADNFVATSVVVLCPQYNK